MDFGDKGAGGVNDLERAVFGLVADGRRHAVGAEDEDGAVGDFADGLDKDGAAAAQLLDHVGVVDDLMVDVHRRAVGLECQFYYIYRADHAGAETSRADPEKDFAVLAACRNVGHKLISLRLESYRKVRGPGQRTFLPVTAPMESG